jgi:hypothetical protein
MATQQGETLKIGFGAAAYTGYIVDEWESSTDADEEIVKAENGDTVTVITMDPRAVHNATFIIKNAGSIAPPAKNSVLTLIPPQGTSTKYRVQTASVRFARGATRLTVSMLKEASMTYA